MNLGTLEPPKHEQPDLRMPACREGMGVTKPGSRPCTWRHAGVCSIQSTHGGKCLPIRVRASHEIGIVVLVFEGVVTEAEFLEIVAPLFDKPEYNLVPLTLVDMTTATEIGGPAETVRAHAQRASFNIDDKIGGEPKLALAAENDAFFGLGRMYEMLRDGSPVAVSVFRSLPEAERWLDLPDDYESQLTDVV